MANRSYLFATNTAPGADIAATRRQLIGIAEHNYDIPIVFKLLVSANTCACPSSIFDDAPEVALAGDYEGGLRALEAFFARIDRSDAQLLIADALTFLRAPENRRTWFVLEAGEIFDMEDDPVTEQNRALLAEVSDLGASVSATLAKLAEVPIRPAPAEIDCDDKAQWPFFALGLGNFSNTLYYDFGGEAA